MSDWGFEVWGLGLGREGCRIREGVDLGSKALRHSDDEGMLVRLIGKNEDLVTTARFLSVIMVRALTYSCGCPAPRMFEAIRIPTSLELGSASSCKGQVGLRGLLLGPKYAAILEFLQAPYAISVSVQFSLFFTVDSLLLSSGPASLNPKVLNSRPQTLASKP